MRGFEGSISDDGRHLFITVWEGTAEKNRLYRRSMSDEGAYLEEANTVRMFDDFDAYYKPIGVVGDRLFLTTDLNAARGRVIEVDLSANGELTLVEVVGENTDTLRSATIVGERLVLNYLHDAHSAVRVYKLDGDLDHQVDLPGIGSAVGFSGSADDTTTFYSYSSYTNPPTIYRYDVNQRASEVFRQPKLAFDGTPFVTEQVFYQSADGTQIPMFLVHRADIELDGNNPTLLYGYGGFNIPLTPRFKVSQLVWLELGGVYAVANLRGGGEYGREWHLAGTQTNKQNVFDDFFAAAEWLISNGYTRRERLAINGGSNGGLLVGAAITQRPELFGAAIPQVGVLDMLRYHLFTIGWAWASDYGRSDDAELFPTLLGYSPLHNLRAGVEYPPTLVMTGDHDDRVVPAHSFKFAAALQHSQAGPNPTLIRIETRAGHGAGKPTEMLIDEVVDKYAFLIEALNIAADSDDQ